MHVSQPYNFHFLQHPATQLHLKTEEGVEKEFKYLSETISYVVVWGVSKTHWELRLAGRDSHPLHSSVSESLPVSSSPASAQLQD